jgi:hypothetical protein
MAPSLDRVPSALSILGVEVQNGGHQSTHKRQLSKSTAQTLSREPSALPMLGVDMEAGRLSSTHKRQQSKSVAQNLDRVPSALSVLGVEATQQTFATGLSRSKSKSLPKLPSADPTTKHQRLLSTSLKLSHLPWATEEQRLAYLRNAAKQSSRGLGQAIISQDESRIAEMAFHAACVEAREVAVLRDAAGRWPTEELLDKRQMALEAIALALSDLESCDYVDIAAFEKLAKQYTKPLL